MPKSGVKTFDSRVAFSGKNRVKTNEVFSEIMCRVGQESIRMILETFFQKIQKLFLCFGFRTASFGIIAQFSYFLQKSKTPVNSCCRARMKILKSAFCSFSRADSNGIICMSPNPLSTYLSGNIGNLMLRFWPLLRRP